VVSIFAIADLPAIAIAVNWWLARRVVPPPVGVGWTLVPLAALAAVLAWLRLRREQQRRAQDAERRTAQEI
jgi:hypothetical protein